MLVNVLSVLGVVLLLAAIPMRGRRRTLLLLGVGAVLAAVALSPTTPDAFWHGFHAVTQ